MTKFTIAAIAMAFAGNAFAATGQDSADIKFEGEVLSNVCTAALVGGETSVKLEPTDVKTVSATTTDSVMKKDFTISLDCTSTGAQSNITDGSYTTVSAYLAPAKGTTVNATSPSLDNSDATGAQGVSLQIQNKDDSNAVQKFTSTDDGVSRTIKTDAAMLFNYNVGYLKTGATVSGGKVTADAMFIATYQ